MLNHSSHWLRTWCIIVLMNRLLPLHSFILFQIRLFNVHISEIIDLLQILISHILLLVLSYRIIRLSLILVFKVILHFFVQARVCLQRHVWWAWLFLNWIYLSACNCRKSKYWISSFSILNFPHQLFMSGYKTFLKQVVLRKVAFRYSIQQTMIQLSHSFFECYVQVLSSSI